MAERLFVGDCGVDRTAEHEEEKHEESCLSRRCYIAAAGIGGGVEDLLGVMYGALYCSVYVWACNADFRYRSVSYNCNRRYELSVSVVVVGVLGCERWTFETDSLRHATTSVHKVLIQKQFHLSCCDSWHVAGDSNVIDLVPESQKPDISAPDNVFACLL